MNNKDKERIIGEIYQRIKKNSFADFRIKRGGGSIPTDKIYLGEVNKILSNFLKEWLTDEKEYLLKVRYALSGIKVYKIKTDDVYRIIGKFYASSLEHIERIDYSQWTPEREQFWIDEGFEINSYRESILSEDEVHKEPEENKHLYGIDIESIADHLIADGWIKPPCKVGDTVYMIMPSGKIRSLTIEGIDIEIGEETKITCMAVYEFEGKSCYDQIQSYKFGKTVFLTKEEAEQKLKGGIESE